MNAIKAGILHLIIQFTRILLDISENHLLLLVIACKIVITDS